MAKTLLVLRLNNGCYLLTSSNRGVKCKEWRAQDCQKKSVPLTWNMIDKSSSVTSHFGAGAGASVDVLNWEEFVIEKDAAYLKAGSMAS